MTSSAVLVVVADRVLQGDVSWELNHAGYAVYAVGSAIEALISLHSSTFGAAVIEHRLPDLSGVELYQRTKAHRRNPSLPAVILAYHQDVPEVVQNLVSGGDDYLTLPLSSGALSRRLQAAIGDAAAPVSARRLNVGNVVIDHRRHQVFVDGNEINLTPTEFDIFSYLVSNADTPISRPELERHVSHRQQTLSSRVIDVQIRNIRKKMGTHQVHIQTIRGIGYRFRIP
mgnify:FL=1